MRARLCSSAHSIARVVRLAVDPRLILALLVLVVPSLAAVGCGTDKAEPARDAGLLVDSGGGDDKDAARPSLASYCDELPELRRLLLDRTCSDAVCHGGDQAQQGLDFTVNDLMTRLSSVPSAQCPEWLLVDPGRPQMSLLYRKLADENPPCGERMPYGGQPISPTLLACVERIIAALPTDQPGCDMCDGECVDLQTSALHCG